MKYFIPLPELFSFVCVTLNNYQNLDRKSNMLEEYRYTRGQEAYFRMIHNIISSPSNRETARMIYLARKAGKYIFRRRYTSTSKQRVTVYGGVGANQLVKVW